MALSGEERRRLVYELLVEAKGLANANKNAKNELLSFNSLAKQATKLAGGIFAVSTAAQFVADMVRANDEILKLTASLKVLGLEGAQLDKAVTNIQNIAVATGQTSQGVASAYKDITDVAQTLGLSQRQVADLTAAATQAMAAQGGTAEQAAQQIGVLAFAIEKGAITGKELKGVLKENEVLQTAFEQALGLTTQQILEQANAGKIGATELRKVLDVYTEIGKQQQVPGTVSGLATSFFELAKAFTAGALEGAKFNDMLQGIRDHMPSAAEANEWGKRLTDLFVGGPFYAGVQAQLRELERLKAEHEAIIREGEAKYAPGTTQAYEEQFVTAADIRAGGGRRTERTPEQMEQLAKDAEQRREDYYKFWRDMDSQLEHSMTMTSQYEDEIQSVTIPTQQDLTDVLSDRAKVTQDILDYQQKELDNYTQVPPKLADIESGFLDARDAAQALTHAIAGIFTGAVHNARDFFRVILEGLAEVALQRALFGSGKGGDEGLLGFLGGLLGAGLGGAAGGGGGIADLGDNLGAKGLALDRGTLIPYAAGGVVSGPTTFGMSSGRTGLMGEAGPEAIMPLRRGRDGKLGIAAALPNIQVINNTGVPANATVRHSSERMQIVLEAAELGRSMALEEVNRSLRSGYGSTAQSVQRTYGLRRRGG